MQLMLVIICLLQQQQSLLKRPAPGPTLHLTGPLAGAGGSPQSAKKARVELRTEVAGHARGVKDADSIVVLL